MTDEVLFYFDPNKLTKLIVDTSSVKLDAVLTQKDFVHENSNIIAYASRSLTPVEQRFSQTEREALAIVWGCEDFCLYLYGAQNPFYLIINHHPPELIRQNPSSRFPVRIE